MATPKKIASKTCAPNEEFVSGIRRLKGEPKAKDGFPVHDVRSLLKQLGLGAYQSLLQKCIGTGEKAPTPTRSSTLLRKQPILLWADFVLTKRPRPLYHKTPPCLLCHKIWELRKISTTTTQGARKENLWRQTPAPSTPTVDMEML